MTKVSEGESPGIDLFDRNGYVPSLVYNRSKLASLVLSPASILPDNCGFMFLPN